MVRVERSDAEVSFEPLGLHKLWSFRRRIVCPAAHVKDAWWDPVTAALAWKGLRLPGTSVFGHFAAGTFRRDGRWWFWDVRRPERAIVVELEGEFYDRLVIEVADPEAAVRMLTAP